jgi:hypothetical protein
MRGGKRIGAGRKQGFAAKNAEEARNYLSERVAVEIGSIADSLINRAKTGDIRAIKELLDRAWGRSPQAVAVSVEKLPIPILGGLSLKSLEPTVDSPDAGGRVMNTTE